jgi:hypothetical protein
MWPIELNESDQSASHHDPSPAALPPGKSPWYPTSIRLEGPQRWSRRFWSRGIEPRSLGRPTHSLVTITDIIYNILCAFKRFASTFYGLKCLEGKKPVCERLLQPLCCYLQLQKAPCVSTNTWKPQRNKFELKPNNNFFKTDLLVNAFH